MHETYPLFLISVEGGVVVSVELNEVYRDHFPEGVAYGIFDNDEEGTPKRQWTDGFVKFDATNEETIDTSEDGDIKEAQDERDRFAETRTEQYLDEKLEAFNLNYGIPDDTIESDL